MVGDFPGTPSAPAVLYYMGAEGVPEELEPLPFDENTSIRPRDIDIVSPSHFQKLERSIWKLELSLRDFEKPKLQFSNRFISISKT